MKNEILIILMLLTVQIILLINMMITSNYFLLIPIAIIPIVICLINSKEKRTKLKKKGAKQ